MKKLMIILFSVLTVNAWAQKETVEILTSASCFEGPCCKERIEEEMQFTRGVTAVDLDIESKVLTVSFKTKKTDANKLRKAISLIGYNADDVKANKKAHNQLPSCCQHLDFKEEE
ncbi:MAG: heavy-metal-associated domain-containing protein [Bacteroidota bacterium]|nr:heavy-metal-associated domain-containing protein [Bacteroidota bacterium]